MREAEENTRNRARTLRKTMTRAEVLLWQHLRRGQLNGHRFKRQVPIGPYIADFACAAARLVIEVDGATHSSDAEIARDNRRSDYLRARGWHVCRVWNKDVFENLEGVLRTIRTDLRDGAFS